MTPKGLPNRVMDFMIEERLRFFIQNFAEA
jgi:hypothetical protein